MTPTPVTTAAPFGSPVRFSGVSVIGASARPAAPASAPV
jgi:hypothetical protein